MKNILEITKGLGIPENFVIPYGWDKAKIDLKYFDQLKDKKETELRLQKEINRLDRQVEQAECRWQRMLDKLNQNADGGYRNE